MMRSRSTVTFAAAALLFAACEDGPKQIFEPNEGNPPTQNGYTPGAPFVTPGSKGFEETGGDSQGRARFCDEAEATALVQTMVTQPLIPDVSVGGIPLWRPDGTPTHADDLLGRPEDGKFCDPWEVYLDAFTWGPDYEVIVLFNQQTRLVEGVIAYSSYLGTLEGSYTNDAQEQVPVVIKARERVTIAGQALTDYTSRADQASKPNAWLNHQNISKVYRMVRETFFAADPMPDGFDCVAAALCDIIYTSSNDSVPQDTAVVMQDSGVVLLFTPDGHVSYIELDPVRVAPFESNASWQFGDTTFAPEFASASYGSCNFTLDEELSFAAFKSRCIEEDEFLARLNYDVHTQRDAVDVEFNGIYLSFLRPTTVRGVLRDGERPHDDDTLYGVTFTRSLNAPVAEFKPLTLAGLYKTKLEARIQSYISDVGNGIAVVDNPLYSYSVSIPAELPDEPQRIGELTYVPAPEVTISWIPEVLADVQATFDAMSAAEQAMIDPRLLEPVYLIEPFVDAVLETFSYGNSELADTFKAFETAEDRRWSIGYAHFLLSGVPYRLIVQYSLNFGAVTAVSLERGYSELDEIINGVNAYMRAELGQPYPYYTLSLSQPFEDNDNPYRLGGSPMGIFGFDRQLKTATVALSKHNGTAWSQQMMKVPGAPIVDESGYNRQIRGERYEFVPAHEIKLYGKETTLLLYIEEDGKLGYMTQYGFKGDVELCDGLSLRYGDDVRRALRAWEATVSASEYRNCDIVFNYSANGAVLYGVTSLANKIEISVADDRAVSASIWR